MLEIERTRGEQLHHGQVHATDPSANSVGETKKNEKKQTKSTCGHLQEDLCSEEKRQGKKRITQVCFVEMDRQKDHLWGNSKLSHQQKEHKSEGWSTKTLHKTL